MSGNRKKGKRLFYADGSPVGQTIYYKDEKREITYKDESKKIKKKTRTTKYYILSNFNNPGSKIYVFTAKQLCTQHRLTKKLFFQDGSLILDQAILNTHSRERRLTIKNYVFLIPNDPSSETEVFTLRQIKLRQIKSRNHASLNSIANEEQSPLLTRSIEEDEVNLDLDLESPIFFDNPTSHESEEERSSIQDNPIAYEPEEEISSTHFHSNQIEYPSSNAVEIFYNSPSLDSPNDVVNNNEINLNFDLNFDFNNQIAVDNFVSSESEEELSRIQFGLDQIEEDLKGLGEANAVENQTLTSVNSWEEEMLRKVPSNDPDKERHPKKRKLNSSHTNNVVKNVRQLENPTLTHFSMFASSSSRDIEPEKNRVRKARPWEL